jgi:hypothetical protein
VKVRPVLTLEQRRDAIVDAARATGVVTTLRAAGEATAMTTARRDELLAQCAGGAYVELELDMQAYEQAPNVRNRKNVRHRDGGLMSLGRSGVGTPFMRDHNQGDSLSRGGTIIASATEKLGDGHYVIRQTAKLTAPWAVELALRGLLDTLSIGWQPTGAVHCSICDTPVFEDCYHWRGDSVEGADGTQQVVEWVFQSAELVETSCTPVPAVTSARIDAIRMALSLAADPVPGALPAQKERMNLLAKLLPLLGLAATAGDSEALSAVEALKADRAELKVVQAELAAANVELAAIRDEKRKIDEDKLFADTIARGAMAPNSDDEKAMREFYSVAPDRASARLAARKDNSVTPVGMPRQSRIEPVTTPALTTPITAQPAQLAAEASRELEQRRVDPGKVVELANLFGVENPATAIAEGLKKGA